MAFADLKDFLDPDLHIPFRGKTYTIPAASFEDGLYLQDLFNLGVKARAGADPTDADKAKLNDDDEREFYRRSLTPGVFQELQDDGVPFPVIKLMAGTAMMECVFGRDEAEAFWASGGKAQKPTKKPQDRKQKTGTRTRTGGARTTQKQGSASGTSTPKGKGEAEGTPGGTS